MKTLRLLGITWLCGFITMILALGVKQNIWADELGREMFLEYFTVRDFPMVLLGSAVAMGASFVAIYLPSLALLRRALRGVSPVWLFAAVPAATALLLLIMGRTILPHHPQAPFITPDMLVLCWMLTVGGIVAGLGFVHRHRAAALHRLDQ